MGGDARGARAVAAGPVPADAGRPEAPFARWQQGLRKAVDLCVAFATLADTDAPTAAADDDAGPDARGSASATRAAARRSEGASSRAVVDAADHPHRAPLRPKLRPRRPGEAVRRPETCLSPVGRVIAPAPKRRTRA